MIVSLDTVREHCRIDPGDNGENSLLTIYIGAAKRHIERWTRRNIYETNADPGFSTDENRLLLDDDIRLVVLLLVGHWYENREASVTGVSVSTLPLAVEALLQPYRIYGL